MKFFLPSNKKIYFASDLHLTTIDDERSRLREREFVGWLERVRTDAAAVFLLGDIFDFWFEYRYVVPRGFVRLLGKLAELTDSGISIFYFTGNHDRWMRDYFSKELHITVFRKHEEFDINGKLFFLGHGHEVGFYRRIDKLLNYMFGSSFLRTLFAAIHPRWGYALGKNWSYRHLKQKAIVKPAGGHQNDPIFKYAKKMLAEKRYDFFVFGHKHLAADIQIGENSRYINTGEWIENGSYAVYDGKEMTVYPAANLMQFFAKQMNKFFASTVVFQENAGKG